MELNADLIGIQGIVTSVQNKTGILKNIYFKGGNESKLNMIVKDLKTFLVSKGYINDKNEINHLHRDRLKDITTFLTLNTEFKEALNMKEFEHLINIMPTFSKCVLVNVVVGLELTQPFGASMHIMPLHFAAEMFEEYVPCLKWISPEQALAHTYIVIEAIITKLQDVDMDTSYKVRESVDQLSDVCTKLLLPLLGINMDEIQGWKKRQLYCHIGHTLLVTLKLLMCCEPTNAALGVIIDKLIMSVSHLLQLITINIYCAWAEIQFEGQVLQMLVSEKAYCVLEKYSKFKPAAELIGLLSNIAKKPKTLEETILYSSEEAIISKIYSCCADQREWFRALLNTQVFHSKDAMKCLYDWSNLCSLENVVRVMKLSMNYKTVEANKLVNKCASNLSVEELSIAMSRFFHNFGLDNHLEFENVPQVLTYSLNKINHSKEFNLSLHELDSAIIKEIQLLLLQNPQKVIEILYSECIKNKVYTYWLRHAFLALKEFVQIEFVAVKVLKGIVEADGLHEDNYMGVVHLMQMLLDTNCVDKQSLMTIIQLENFSDSDLKYRLLVIKEAVLYQLNLDGKKNLTTLLIRILENSRSKFNEFTMLRIEICIVTIELIKSINFTLTDCNFCEHPLNKYYLSTTNDNMLMFVFQNFDMENYGEAVSKLLQILSRCVPEEWNNIAKELHTRFGAKKTLEALSDQLIMICEVTKTQNQETNPMVFEALQFYLQNYAISIKNLKENESDLEFEVEVIKQVCRLLRLMPPSIKRNEGFKLITLFSNEALKSLAQDKQFVCSLVAIKDSELTQIIAKKMLST